MITNASLIALRGRLLNCTEVCPEFSIEILTHTLSEQKVLTMWISSWYEGNPIAQVNTKAWRNACCGRRSMMVEGYAHVAPQGLQSAANRLDKMTATYGEWN